MRLLPAVTMTTDPFPNQLAELCRTEPTRAKWVLVPAHTIGHTVGERLALEAASWANVRFRTRFENPARHAALLVKNGAAKPVLILDGEELVGAKQNRIVNLTILVAAQQTLHIPVSCVEAGRWARRSREFASAGRAHYATGRARTLEQVSCAMRETGSREADQSDVGRSITQHRSTIHHCLAVRPHASLPTVVLCLGTMAFFNDSHFRSTRRTAPPGRRPSRMMAS
jgi:hypothetical protein